MSFSQHDEHSAFNDSAPPRRALHNLANGASNATTVKDDTNFHPFPDCEEGDPNYHALEWVKQASPNEMLALMGLSMPKPSAPVERTLTLGGPLNTVDSTSGPGSFPPTPSLYSSSSATSAASTPALMLSRPPPLAASNTAGLDAHSSRFKFTAPPMAQGAPAFTYAPAASGHTHESIGLLGDNTALRALSLPSGQAPRRPLPPVTAQHPGSQSAVGTNCHHESSHHGIAPFAPAHAPGIAQPAYRARPSQVPSVMVPAAMLYPSTAGPSDYVPAPIQAIPANPWSHAYTPRLYSWAGTTYVPATMATPPVASSSAARVPQYVATKEAPPVASSSTAPAPPNGLVADEPPRERQRPAAPPALAAEPPHEDGEPTRRKRKVQGIACGHCRKDKRRCFQRPADAAKGVFPLNTVDGGACMDCKRRKRASSCTWMERSGTKRKRA